MLDDSGHGKAQMAKIKTKSIIFSSKKDSAML